MRALRALALALVVLLPAARPGAAREEPISVNTRLGTLAGVRMGDSAGAIERKLGPAAYVGGFRPRAAARFTGPPKIKPPDGIQPAVAEYREHAFLVGSVGTYALTTVSARAVTQRGVRIGASLDSVKRVHRKAVCGRASASEEPGYRWCRARAGRNTVFYGGDPIESITIIRVGRTPRPRTSRIVDVRRGVYRGVRLGATKRQVTARLGTAPAWSDPTPMEPLVRAIRAASPTLPRAQSLDVLRYPDVAYVLSAGRVYAIVVGGNAAGPRPKTVAIGAKLDVARRPYGALRCARRARAGGGQLFRFCTGAVAPRRYLWLGDDPVASVVLSTVPLR